MLVAVEPVAQRAAGPVAGATRGGHRAVVRRSSADEYEDQPAVASSSPEGRGRATATRRTPNCRRTWNGSCSTTRSARHVGAQRWRRWRSSRTSSRSRGPRSPRIRGVDPDGVIRTLQARGYIDRGRPRRRAPGQAILFGTTAVSSSRSSASTRWPTCRPSPSSCRHRGPRSWKRWSTACASTHRPTQTCLTASSNRRCGSSGRPSPRSCRRANACRRCWPFVAGAVAACART
jgi:hypothetical protein